MEKTFEQLFEEYRRESGIDGVFRIYGFLDWLDSKYKPVSKEE